MKPDTWTPEKFNEAAKKEADNLEHMNKMGSKDPTHFIRGIAYYTQAGGHFFLFPWAEGGNLEQYWATADPTRESTHCWALRQMAGLASCIHKLHDGNYRHGDLKPQNILCFGDSNSADGLRLVIADVGLAKVHKEFTQFREGATATDATSVTYSPPEFELNSLLKKPISRLLDIWSIGCLFLEFVIWLAAGKDALHIFREGLRGEDLRRPPVPFWVQNPGSPQRELHPMVTGPIDILLGNLKSGSPLHHVVELIKNRMLVIEISPHNKQLPRMDSEGEVGSASPSLQVTPATTNFGIDHTYGPYRAEAKEFNETMSTILKGVNTTTYKFERAEVAKAITAMPGRDDLLSAGNARRTPRGGGETPKIGKPLVCRCVQFGRFSYLRIIYSQLSFPSRMYVKSPRELK